MSMKVLVGMGAVMAEAGAGVQDTPAGFILPVGVDGAATPLHEGPACDCGQARQIVVQMMCGFAQGTGADLQVQHSVDGVNWVAPTPAVGLTIAAIGAYAVTLSVFARYVRVVATAAAGANAFIGYVLVETKGA